jgi:hypothetical protein
LNKIGKGFRSRLAPLFVFALLFLAATAVPVLAETAQESADGQTSAPAKIPAPSPEELAPIEAEEREQAEQLTSPDAVREREDSEFAYAELSAKEARSLLVESFPGPLKALDEDPGRVISQLEVQQPLGLFGAVVTDDDGETSILESSAPVQSEVGGEGRQPVDLTLESTENGFAPVNPITPIELPTSSTGSIRLDEGVGIRLPAGSDREAVPLGKESLFFPETEATTDTLVSPIAGGVEISEQLRSAESPGEFSFGLDFPAGAALETSPRGGAEN